jgi:hypothetical protein
VAFLAVDPTTLQIAHTATLMLPSGVGVPTGALAAGRFRDRTHDDLIAVGDVGSAPDANTLTVYSISLDTPQRPQVVTTTPLSTSKPRTIRWVKAKSGRLDWFNAADQLVLGVATDDQGTAIIGTFDQDLNITQYGPTTVTDDKGCLYDLAVGNFDRQNADGTRNYNLQLAILWSPGQSCGGFPFSDFPATTMNVSTWSVSPESDFSLTGMGATLVVPSVPEGGVDEKNSQTLAFGFAVGDTQGRSVLVGPPEKVTIVKSIQPDIALGIPPMHIDYIRDINNLGPDGTPAVLNLTVKPSVPAPGTAFNTQFNFSSSASTSATRKSTTRWSLSVKVTNQESASFGIPAIGSVGASIKTSAGFTHDGSVAKQYNRGPGPDARARGASARPVAAGQKGLCAGPAARGLPPVENLHRRGRGATREDVDGSAGRPADRPNEGDPRLRVGGQATPAIRAAAEAGSGDVGPTGYGPESPDVRSWAHRRIGCCSKAHSRGAERRRARW